MATSSTISVPSILIGESFQKTVIFNIELTRGPALSSAFLNADIVLGWVYKHMNMEPMVVQKLDAKTTLLVVQKCEEIEKICNTLSSIEIWLGCSLKVGCSVATCSGIDWRLIMMGGKRASHIKGGWEHTSP